MLDRLRKYGRTKSAMLETAAEPPTSSRTTFFDFPAELRNTVYELVADCTLRLRSGSDTPFMIPGLLLTSRKCRSEYTSILLATARLEVSITDMNFNRLLLTFSTLDSSSRKALASNKHLLITLRVRKCGSDIYANLRKWCEESKNIFQADEDAPVWTYIMDKNVQTNAAQLDWYCGRVRVLEQRVSAEREDVKAETRKILRVLEDERTGVSGTASWSMGYGDAYALYASASARRI
ncbi:hypothetical protein CERZMDRAFT_102688 [Cercospora zeae-maydis SCOH1-5]|uniref:Uncharacterized protein n=1 Tax=Cercospora zeae-maydis SCOH1-5 TaxID=717836 RepID=A0A6A6F187_9PEZI|nr:hypothetical protein CERZMDRAFT_102688 [Cercospora zeae-maydis SCOH1-5]